MGVLTYFSPTEPEILHIEPNIKYTSEDFEFLERALDTLFEKNLSLFIPIFKKLINSKLDGFLK